MEKYLCPHPEYGMHICPPNLVADINYLEIGYKAVPYEERQHRLDLHSSQQWQVWADTDLLDVDPDMLFLSTAHNG